MQAWVANFVDARQPWANAAGEDTVSRLLRLTGLGLSGLDRQGVISNVCGLLVGAIETTSQAIVNDGADPAEPGASGPCDPGRT
jgi:cytochrome P450